MFAFIYDNGYCEDANFHVMLAKKNDEAGTGKHNLRLGKRGFENLAVGVLIDYGRQPADRLPFPKRNSVRFPSKD